MFSASGARLIYLSATRERIHTRLESRMIKGNRLVCRSVGVHV